MSSGGMYFAPLTTKELFATTFAKFDGVRRYALTKRAQVALTEVWAKKGAEQGLIVHSCIRMSSDSVGNFYLVSETDGAPFEKSDGGADTVVWLVHYEPLQSNGLFWFDRECRRRTSLLGNLIQPRKNLGEIGAEVAPYIQGPS